MYFSNPVVKYLVINTWLNSSLLAFKRIVLHILFSENNSFGVNCWSSYPIKETIITAFKGTLLMVKVPVASAIAPFELPNNRILAPGNVVLVVSL